METNKIFLPDYQQDEIFVKKKMKKGATKST